MAGADDTTAGTAATATLSPIEAGVASLDARLVSLVEASAWQLSDDEVRVELARVLAVRAGVEELAARLVRSVMDRDLPRLAGASSTRSWLMGTHGVSGPDAGRLVTEAHAHPGDPDGVTREGRCEPTRLAWSAGDLSAERAVVVASTIAKLSPDLPATVTADVQAELVAQSPVLGFRQFQRLCAHVVEVVDPDAADALLEAQLLAQEAAALQATSLSFRRVGDGTTRLSGRLPDVQADMFKALLDGYSSPRRTCRTDPDSPYVRLPDDDDGADVLSYPQRTGLALVEVVEHLPTDRLPRHGVGSASVVVTMTLDQLLGTIGETVLDTGTTMSAGQARRLACNATLIPAVLGGDSKVLNLGAGRRLFDRHQRLALALRDGGCMFPGCEREPSWTEAHHILEWSRGGRTDLANGCLMCPFHHHLIHAGEWQVVMAADGIPEVIPPARIDPEQKPRRHERLTPKRC